MASERVEGVILERYGPNRGRGGAICLRLRGRLKRGVLRQAWVPSEVDLGQDCERDLEEAGEGCGGRLKESEGN